MLPEGSLRFFTVDPTWIECLLDGAFSVGRVTSAAFDHDITLRQYVLPTPTTRTGFLLRSPVVRGWPTLGVEAYTQTAPDDTLPADPTPWALAPMPRMDRLNDETLFCLFDGTIVMVDIHEHTDTIHFGVHVDTKEEGDTPEDSDIYTKTLRNVSGASGTSTTPIAVPWRNRDKRVLAIGELATLLQATNSANFGLQMIEGVEKVRFVKTSPT